MSTPGSSEQRALLILADQLGARVSRTRKGHLRLRLPSGRVVIASGSSRSVSGWRNATATLRRLGRQTIVPGE
jgi:hypothetical protein